MSNLLEQIKQLKAELAAYQNGGVEAVENLKNNGGNGEMNKEIVEGLGKVKAAVDGLKAREPYKWEKQVENFLNDGVDPRVAAAKEKFLEMGAREQAAFRQANPELYEKMFPSEKVEMPKPNNYDTFKKLVMQNEKDVAKLPYNVRLFAANNDPEFAAYIAVADASLQAAQNTNMGNPLLKKMKEMEAAKVAQEGQA